MKTSSMTKGFMPILILIVFVMASCKDQQKELISQAEALRAEAWSNLEGSDFAAAISLAREAKTLDSIAENPSGKAKSLYIMARAMAFSGDFNSVLKYGQKGAELCRSLEEYELEYKVNNMISWAQFELGTEMELILSHLERQLWIVEQLEDEGAKADVFNNYGYDATVAGTVHLDTTMAYSKLANDYYSRTENHNGRWYSLMNLNWQHRLKGELDKSEEYGLLSVHQARADQDRHAMVEACTQLAETYLAKGAIDKALPYYEEGLKWRGSIDDRDGYVFDVYYARYFWETGQRNKAIEILEEAVEFLKESEVFYEMHGRALLADFYQKNGRWEAAKDQILMIDHPRAHFISFETKCLAEMVKRRLLKDQETSEVEPKLEEYYMQARSIGADYLVAQLESI